MRKILIGDIHGCFTELDKLLKKIRFDEAEDMLIFLGDYMDRGPSSFQVFENVLTLKRKMKDRCVLLLGNHDWLFIKAIKDDQIMEFWDQNGKEPTERSFEENLGRPLTPDNADYQKCADQLNYYTELYYEDDLFQCVHAHLINEDPSLNNEDVVLWGRNTANDYNGKLTIVGHTPLKEPLYLSGYGDPLPLSYEINEQLPGCGMINIDTGCVFGRKLTAMIIEEDKYRLEYVDKCLPPA